MQFEWDEKKSILNMNKHEVTFHEASTVFGDPLAITFDDPDHSLGEHRYLTFGYSRTHLLLAVSHTERNGRTRIISARRVANQERTIYEKG